MLIVSHLARGLQHIKVCCVWVMYAKVIGRCPKSTHEHGVKMVDILMLNVFICRSQGVGIGNIYDVECVLCAKHTRRTNKIP